MVKYLADFFEHKRLKPANIRTVQGNVQNLVKLKTNNKCGT